MKRLTCEMCGSTDLIKQDGVFVCQSCGCKYSVEEARKMMIEGTVEVQGTVTVDNSHMISNYLEMAINAHEASNQLEAESYCNRIIEIEPTNYQAWMLKGKAAGWQSTLQNSRVPEAVSAFSKAIQYAPEEVKEKLAEDAKTEIVSLSKATLSLRGDRFSKWPDAEETAGFLTDLTSILETVLQFLSQTGSAVSISEIMGPAATIINQSVVKAYMDVIKPEYKSDRYPWPDDDDFRKFIERIGYCTKLVEKAIDLCDNDDDEDVQRYENLIFLHKEAINACSYDWEYYDLDEQWKVNLARSHGLFPVASENRVYAKNLSLNDSAIAARNSLIQKYERKVKELKSAKDRRIAAEKAEEERKAKEEARKRFDAYWAQHADDKARLESERKALLEQIASLDAAKSEQVAELKMEIAAISGQTEIDNLEEKIKKLSDEKASLGVFKGKEKKAIQEQVDQAAAEKKAIQDRMDEEKRGIERRITDVINEIQAKINQLQSKVNNINTELTKAR